MLKKLHYKEIQSNDSGTDEEAYYGYREEGTMCEKHYLCCKSVWPQNCCRDIWRGHDLTDNMNFVQNDSKSATLTCKVNFEFRFTKLKTFPWKTK